MTSDRRLVCLVEDDESVRESLPDLLRAFDFQVEAFASARGFLASPAVERTGCLILDIAMPDMTGPELQGELARRDQDIPIVFITAQADEALCARLIRRGAVACIRKPFSEAAILEAIRTVFARM